MITENKNQDKHRNFGGLNNKIQQNRSPDKEQYQAEENIEEIEIPVNNGGVNTSIKTDIELEEQWLAVRDEYLAHYPNITDNDTHYKKGDFDTIIENLAKKRQRTPKEIHTEIINWPANI
jgi:hypothetical protein